MKWKVGIYCELADEEAEICKDQIDGFIRENDILGWNG